MRERRRGATVGGPRRAAVAYILWFCLLMCFYVCLSVLWAYTYVAMSEVKWPDEDASWDGGAGERRCGPLSLCFRLSPDAEGHGPRGAGRAAADGIFAGAVQ